MIFTISGSSQYSGLLDLHDLRIFLGLGSHDPSRAFAVSDLTILRELTICSRISRIRSHFASLTNLRDLGSARSFASRVSNLRVSISTILRARVSNLRISDQRSFASRVSHESSRLGSLTNLRDLGSARSFASRVSNLHVSISTILRASGLESVGSRVSTILGVSDPHDPWGLGSARSFGSWIRTTLRSTILRDLCRDLGFAISSRSDPHDPRRVHDPSLSDQHDPSSRISTRSFGFGSARSFGPRSFASQISTRSFGLESLSRCLRDLSRDVFAISLAMSSRSLSRPLRDLGHGEPFAISLAISSRSLSRTLRDLSRDLFAISLAISSRSLSRSLRNLPRDLRRREPFAIYLANLSRSLSRTFRESFAISLAISDAISDAANLLRSLSRSRTRTIPDLGLEPFAISLANHS